MPRKYAYHIHEIKLSPDDALRVTGNIAIFASLYTIAGGIMSFVLYYLFDVYEPDEQRGLEWEKKGLTFQIVDVAVEIALVGVGAFWLVYFINTSAPIIPIRHGLEDFVDSYTSGVFFMFAVLKRLCFLRRRPPAFLPASSIAARHSSSSCALYASALAFLRAMFFRSRVVIARSTDFPAK
jgi:hypothetical protein